MLAALSAAAVISPVQAPAPVAGASAQAGASTTAPLPWIDKEDRIVCRSVRQTGSRFPVRECMTEAERELRAAQARRDKDRQYLRGRPRRGR
ncbi:MAG: hypothetical protein KY446_03755 [Proteobacteria bacterium]|nr:hypothetical protein [Pseudomonadota bacterium]